MTGASGNVGDELSHLMTMLVRQLQLGLHDEANETLAQIRNILAAHPNAVIDAEIRMLYDKEDK